MAPSGESSYFPGLDACLPSSSRLLSWRAAYNALAAPSTAVDSSALEAFLTSDDSKQLLAAGPGTAFFPRTAQSKATFDGKTAPINATRDTCGEYNLDDIKADALWASKEADLDEVSALRIVILEWQSRTEDQLLLASSQRPTSAQNAFSASVFSQSRLDVSVAPHKDAGPDFRKEEVRRQRQVEILLEEQSHIIKLRADLVARNAVRNVAKASRTWIDALAEETAGALRKGTEASHYDELCCNCVTALEDLVTQLSSQSSWKSLFKDDEVRQAAYVAASLTDIGAVLRILLSVLHDFEGIPSAILVKRWFSLMRNVEFLQNLQPTTEFSDVPMLQCMISVASLAILALPRVLLHINETAEAVLSGASYPSLSDAGYFESESTVQDVNLILYYTARAGLPVASPALFAWGISSAAVAYMARLQRERRASVGDESEAFALQRSSSFGSLSAPRRRRSSVAEMGFLEKRLQLFQDSSMDPRDSDDPAAFYLRSTVEEMRVYSIILNLSTTIAGTFASETGEAFSFVCRGHLLDLVREGMASTFYDEDVVDALLAILSPDVPTRNVVKSLDWALADRVLSDSDVFGPAVLDQALARYPFELTPLLKLYTSLASASNMRTDGPANLVHKLENLTALTMQVPAHFNGYQLDHEDENLNAMVLTEDLPIFLSKYALNKFGAGISRKAITLGRENDGRARVLSVLAGSAGNVVKESRPMVFRIDHVHSALEYLGILLSTILPNGQLAPASAELGVYLDRATAADIISLANALLKATLRQSDGIDDAKQLIGRLSYALSDEQDFISIVADVLEVELMAHLDQTAQEDSLTLLTASMEFMDILTTVSPERVWSVLSRSSLLGITGGDNAFAAVVAGTEVPGQRFPFLTGCVKLFGSLLHDAATGAIKRRGGNESRALTRFQSAPEAVGSTPERTMTVVLSAYQTIILDIWQSLSGWRFAIPEEQSQLVSSLLETFTKLVRIVHGTRAAERKLWKPLVGLTSQLMETLSFEGSPSLQRFTDVFDATAKGLAVGDALPHSRQLLVNQANAAALLISKLVRTMRSAKDDSGRGFIISKAILKTTPTLAVLLAMEPNLRYGIATLLNEVVQGLNASEKTDVPSILSHLRADTAKSFLGLIRELDKPLRNIKTEAAMWSFLSAVMTNKQQWFAIYLLTGSLPKERLRSIAEESNVKKRSLLSHALGQLSDMTSLSPERARATLKFVSSAQNAWVWATNEVCSHPEFLKSCTDWLSKLQPPNRSTQEIITATEHQMAAYLCDIIAVCVHASMEIGDKTLLQMIVPKLESMQYLPVQVSAYNRSLHKNLAENFNKKFPSCEVADFERSSANEASFGREFYYDVSLATEVLGHEAAWAGTRDARQSGFAEEFARANLNLSVVEAQKALLQSWSVLLTTLCECVDQDAKLHKFLTKSIEQCLIANAEANLDLPGMADVLKIRAEVSFVVLSQLAAVKAANADLKALLPAAWILVRSSPADFDVATAAEDLTYYRTLLQILYLALQAWSTATGNKNAASATRETNPEHLPSDTASACVEIVARVVAPGFRALCGNLHSDPSRASPADFALITAVLQAILEIPGISIVHSQLAETLAVSGIARGALSLYSWADRIRTPSSSVENDDPVYATAALTLLHTLTLLPPLSANLTQQATLLPTLLSAPLTQTLTQTTYPPPPRLHHLFTTTMLPLLLNLLTNLGPGIAPEILAFLSPLTPTITRIESSLEPSRPRTNFDPLATRLSPTRIRAVGTLLLLSKLLKSSIETALHEGLVDGAAASALSASLTSTSKTPAGAKRPGTGPAGSTDPTTLLDFNDAKVTEELRALRRLSLSALQARCVPGTEVEAVWAGRSASSSVGGGAGGVGTGDVGVEGVSELVWRTREEIRWALEWDGDE